ncbi:DUF5518 domain-containing protein [Haloarchaeobius amylolyticus]|uniref:DUF5518 domain-containing protein n=1 Tax=Haloarchaeobius amylolyticus TaxID=1198296 RepID=A0ABD6BJH0_9EURY
MVRTRTLINAVIGAVISVVLSFIPGSTVLGGAIAGFLEGPDERAGAIAGALAGAITFIPFLGIGFLLAGVLSLGLLGGVPIEGVFLFTFVIFSAGFFLLLYTVGLSLLGGYLGAYLAREYPDRHRRTRETVGFDTDPTDSSRRSDASSTRDDEFGDASAFDTGLEDSSNRADDRDAGRERDRDSDREL